ncbi:NAD-dependent epimerase/dehydratase family protein [Patiriisocius hiemis]|uniref:NAD-dependent epimerase/dehydratase family protein n=1 Tax=Patiriisocius hiemis TaxID=3075604 RepID=A0ABU2YGM0_9FLAO|nr:NAD-dependent epimerase/dehydratase family protein [Constantimarinum sp. W242]MDT0556390.1 NAD-dependent epimerase/dehydratase family protein [Constantimarinum sp. W242]
MPANTKEYCKKEYFYSMILVTGGTGLVGSHLLYFLLKSNTTVRAIHRKNSDLVAVKKVFSYYTKEVEETYARIEWCEANLTDIPALTEAFKDIKHVYHAAAYISFDPKNYYKLKKSNIEGTANIVNMCLANKVKKIVYVSSVATLGKTNDNSAITEKTQWNAEGKNSVYAITKFGAEMEVWRGTQEGLNAIILNPSIILGSGFWDEGSSKLIKNAIEGQRYITKGGNGFVDVIDVVKALITCMNSNVSNEQYILNGANVLYKDFFEKIATIAGSKPPSTYISKWILLVATTIDWFISTLFGTKRKLLKSIVSSMFTVSSYDASKIEQEFELNFTPIEETLERVVKRYKQES